MRSAVRYFDHLHITTWSVPFSNHKVTTRVIVPCDVELATSQVLKVDLGVIVGPVLDGVGRVLARLNGLRRGTCNAGNGRDGADY
jgi:hypothetical protein